MAPRLLACALVSAAVGCGGVTAAGPQDASADVLVTDAQIAIDAIAADSTTPPTLITDAGADEASTFVDVSPLPPFDASLPALPDCDAGGYFVTIDDGAGVRVLDGGCADAGAWAVPALVGYSCGNLCGYAQIEVCGGGLSLMLQENAPFLGISSAVSFGVGIQFDDGNGNLLFGSGTLNFAAPPFASGAHGTTLAGSYYTQILTTPHGQPVGAIAGTFCVLDGF